MKQFSVIMERRINIKNTHKENYVMSNDCVIKLRTHMFSQGSTHNVHSKECQCRLLISRVQLNNNDDNIKKIKKNLDFKL